MEHPFLTLLVLGVLVVFAKLLEGWRADGSHSKFSRALFNTKIPASSSILGVDGQSGMAIADDESALLCGTLTNAGFAIRKVPISEILSAEIVEDGDSITKTARGSQVGGALVGGLLLGPAGAVIGGLSGTKRSIGVCRLIELRITVNSTSAPTHVVCFQATELKKTNSLYTHNLDQARTWQAKVAVLIRRGEHLMRAEPVAPHLVSAALVQLGELRDKGILTPDEFEVQKTRLLASPPPVSLSSSKIESYEPPPRPVSSLPPARPIPAPKVPLTPEKRAELLAKARALAAERDKGAGVGEHRLDID